MYIDISYDYHMQFIFENMYAPNALVDQFALNWLDKKTTAGHRPGWCL